MPEHYDRSMIPSALTSSGANPCIGTPLQWGPLALETNLLLAPVANYCDLAWRLVCREQGCVGLACTDLLSPQGLLRGTAHSLDLAKTVEGDSPLGMQLYGSDPEILAEGAVWAVKHGADAIDINMGCPVDKVTKKDGGSALLCTPERTVKLAARVVMEVERATRGRVGVSAKLRLGPDDSCIVAPGLARELERVGICGITVHGRTTEQKFKGAVSLEGIRDVVQAVERVPVLGNGDVTEPAHAVEMMERTGCAGVMIGRGSFSRPWIFRQAWGAQVVAAGASREDDRKTIEQLVREPEEAEKVAVIARYFALMREHRDDHYAMTHIRRRISWMSKTLGRCKPFKEAVRVAAGPGEVERAMVEFLAGGLRRFPGEGPGAADEHEADAAA